MPVYKSDALILRTYKLGEADRIVVFLTRDRGKKRGVAKGARRPRSRYMGALEPLTRGEVAYFEREQRELVHLNYMDPVRSPLSAPTGEALEHVGYFAELIDEWAPEAHADERLFRLGASIVDALAGGAPIDRLARYFEYWLLRLQGVYPAPSGMRLSSGALRFLVEAGSTSPESVASLDLTVVASRELEAAHRRLINHHLEKELKSARVLREMRHTR
jgi:DNA repair protein RecO (recombination protein O)